MHWKTKGFDVASAVLLLYGAIWIYELSNYAVLAMVGSEVSLSLQGIFPAAVSGVVANGSYLAVAKPFQVLLAMLGLGPVALLLKRHTLPFTEVAVVSCFSVFLASFYWEFLSLIGPLSQTLHMTIFSILIGTIQLTILKARGLI